MDVILSIKSKLSNRSFYVNVIILFAYVSYFLPMLLLELIHFLQAEIFLKLVSLNFHHVVFCKSMFFKISFVFKQVKDKCINRN